MSQPEHPRDEQPGRSTRAWCTGLTGLAAVFGLLGLPGIGAAAPPETSPFAELPSPDELPDDLADELADDLADDLADASKSSKSSKPAPKPAKADEPTPTQSSSPPESEPAPDDEPEPEPKPKAKPKWKIQKLKKAKWIKHTVVPGERLDEIAARYQVRKGSLIRWNKLDPDKPMIYAGRDLAVYTKHIPPPQQKLIYEVKRGDTWPKIAKAYRVDQDHLRLRWNSKVPRKFKVGQEIVIWVDPLSDPDLLGGDDEPRARATAGTSAGASGTAESSSSASAPASLPLIKISTGSISVGKPNRGKIVNAIQLPENDRLYSVRKPDESWGSSHALHNLQLAIAHWRHGTGYAGELVIGAISKKGGGKLRPHSSHQSGRDVDVRLPLKRAGGESENVEDVDWDATWALIQALVATGEVQYIFLSTSRQKHLYKAAKRAGASKDMLERVIQYPSKSGTNNGIVRDAKGHTAHFHVRFTCAANETRCESY